MSQFKIWQQAYKKETVGFCVPFSILLYELVAQVLAGHSNKEVALANGISEGQLYQWVRKYKTLGYNGLVMLKKGRPSKEPQMKNRPNPEPLTESEREELIHLRAENEYIKAENEVIKKRSP